MTQVYDPNRGGFRPLQPGDFRGGPLPDGVDRSGTIAVGGQAVSLAPANAARTFLKGQNVSSGDLWINEVGGAAVEGGAGSYRVTPGTSFSVNTGRAVSIVGPTAGQRWTATEA